MHMHLATRHADAARMTTSGGQRIGRGSAASRARQTIARQINAKGQIRPTTRFRVDDGPRFASATAPVYISEVAPPDIRGRLVTFFQLAVTIGIVVAYLVGLAFDSSEGWRWMLGLGAVPAFALGIGMLRMPQSPRWLVMAGRDFEARAVLARLRSGDPDALDHEIDEIRGEVAAKPGTWADLRRPAVRRYASANSSS